MRKDAHHHMTKTAITPEALVPLARAAVVWRGEPLQAQALADLGSPSRDDVVAAAIAGLDSPDRNIRSAMLRVLSLYGGDDVAGALLRASHDEKPRVRRTAVLSMFRFLDRVEILDRLQEIVLDEDEHPKVRRQAFSELAGRAPLPYGERPPNGQVAPLAVRHLEAVMAYDQHDRERGGVLFALVRAPLDEDVRGLLERFVAEGTKQEAITATRALCGYRVRRVEEFSDPELAARVPRECERAGGRVWWWVPRSWDGEA